MRSGTRKAARQRRFFTSRPGTDESNLQVLAFQQFAASYYQGLIVSGEIMKNWYLPVVVLGLSGLGLLFASERGREQVRIFFDRVARGEDPFKDFNKAVEHQLANIQNTLDQ